MVKLIICCVTLLTLTIGGLTNSVKKHLEKKFVEEVLSKVDKGVDKCEDFEKYVCGKSEILKETNLDQKRYLPIYYNFEENCKKATHQQYSVSDIIEQIPFLKLCVDNSLKEDPDFNKEDVAEIAAHFHEGSFLDFGFDLENNLIISTKRQFNIYKFQDLDNNKFIQYGAMIDKFVEDANKVIEKRIDTNDDTEIIELKTVKELKELIPTKHFDWEKYVSVLQNLYGMKNFNGIKIFKDNLIQLKEYFEVIDANRIETLINYGIYRYIFVLYNLGGFFCGEIEHFFLIISYIKYFWTFAIESENQLEAFQFFDKTFNESLANIPNSNVSPFYNYFENKYSLIVQHNETFREMINGYEYNKFFKNYKLFDSKMKKFQLQFAHIFASSNGIDDFHYYYQNRPMELIMIKEHFQTNKIFFELNNFWENKDVAEKCANNNLHEMSKFFDVIAAIEYSMKSFDDASLTPLTGKQLFFIVLTQHYCIYKDRLDYIIKAFKYSTTFTEEFNCTEGSKMYYKKREECSIGYCPYESELLRSYLPFEFTDCK